MRYFYLALLALFVSALGFGQVILTETLRTGSLPSGWSQTNVNFATSTGGYANFTWLNAVLETPNFDSSANASVDLSFDVAKFGSGTDGPITIEYSLDGGINWIVQGDSTTPTSPTYQSNTISIPTTSSTMRIRFIRSNSLSQKRLRDVVIEGIGTGVSNDSDTEAYDSGSQPSSTTISSLVDTEVEAIAVFEMDIEDFNTTDALDTNITNVRLKPYTTNTADWTDNIQGVTLNDGSLVTISNINVDDSFIDIVIASGDLVIAGGTSKTISVGLYLNTSGITDGGIISFMIDADDNGFTADATGSTFASDFATFGDFNSNDFTIDVDADELRFIQQPSDTFVNTPMSPDLEVAYTDENGNIDTDYDGAGFDITLTTLGSFDATATTTSTASNGIAVFDNLIFDTTGTSITLSATDNSTFVSGTFDSSTFEVNNTPIGPAVIAQQDFDTNSTWTFSNDVSFFSHEGSNTLNNVYPAADGWTDDGFFGEIDIVNTNSIFNTIEFSGEILGTSDLDDEGDFGAASTTITFSEQDVSSYIDLEIAFDWETVGLDSTDELEYRLIEDGAPGAAIALAKNTFGSEVVTVNALNSIELEIIFTQDGGSDYIGIDNLVLSGTLSGPTTYTFNTGVWTPSDPNGASLSSEAIIIEAGDAIISQNTAINTVTVNPGASLTVDAGATLTVADVTDGLTLESTASNYSSLIRNGTINGTINYERFVNQIGSAGSAGNDLVSIPLAEFDLNFQSFLDFGNPTNRNVLATNPDNTLHAFGPYDNIGLTYVNYPTYAPGLPPDPAAEPLISGKGYRAASTSGANITFTGDALSSNVSMDIGTPTTVINSQWNLIGNPYPSYVDAEKFLLANTTPMEDTAEAIYAYNNANYTGNAATSGNFTIINLITIAAFPGESFNISPGQGFFVPADITPGFTGTINFVTGPTLVDDMRTTSGTDDYISGRNNDITYVFKLGMTTNTEVTTSFFFNDNASRGLDPGYDASTFGNSTIFSHLVENNTGHSIALQALSLTDMSDVIIPLGINANQGEQITFSINYNNLPNDVDVYFEDNVASTITLLNTSDYVVIPNTNLNGTGRFYLRFSNTTLSNPEVSLDNINIYTNQNDKTVVITGQLLEDTTATIYDLHGRLVNQTALSTSEQNQSINVSNLSIGVYILQLKNKSQSKTDKVILN